MDGDDIPDDFFDELVDTQYIDQLVENTHRDGSIRGPGVDDSGDGEGSGGDSPQLARCLAEIDELQRKIQRRKRKLERDLSAHRQDELDLDVDHSNDRGSRDRDRRAREHRTRSRSPLHRARASAEAHFRRRSRSSDRVHRHRHRRSRSRSPRNHQRAGRGGQRQAQSPVDKRASSNHKSLSFLEELAQTFAERGQDFPEKDLLMQPQGPPMHAIDPNAMQNMNVYYPGLQHQYQNPAAVVADFPNPASYYGINPMAMHSEQFAMPAAPRQNVNNLHEIPANFGACAFLDDSLERSVEAEILGKELNAGLRPVESAIEAVTDRCANAVKLLRAEENKVPKLKFIFTRTSTCRTEDDQILSPLESRLNPPFRFNSVQQSTGHLFDSIKSLPTHTKTIAHILGLNSTYMFAKLRAKAIANEIDAEVKKKVEMINADTQTTPIVCNACVVRDQRTFMSRGTQIFEKEKKETSAQTDDEEFLQPLAQMMSRLSSLQLIAVQDFATILLTPLPQNPADMYQMRDQIMDVYNMAHRNGRNGPGSGPDAVYRNDSASGGSYSDRARERGDVDQRFPPNKSRPFNSNNHNDFDGGPIRTEHIDSIDGDYRRDDRFRGPSFDMDQRRDFVDGRRIIEERERERLRFIAEEQERMRLLEERQMEEEHLRQQELINREDLERMRRLVDDDDMRYEQDLMDFNRDSPERPGGMGRPGPSFNNQWVRGEGSRRSRGAWRGKGRGRGR